MHYVFTKEASAVATKTQIDATWTDCIAWVSITREDDFGQIVYVLDAMPMGGMGKLKTQEVEHELYEWIKKYYADEKDWTAEDYKDALDSRRARARYNL